LTEEQQK